MEIKHFFDGRTWTLTYVAYDVRTGDAVIIDSVLDYDPATGRTWQESNELVAAFVADNDLKVHWILETHAHADHLSGSQGLKERTGAGVVISSRITEVQGVFAPVFGLDELATDGSQFDKLVDDGDVLEAGSLSIEVLQTPGHTPACVSYKIDDVVFVGDAIFMPDFGTGRCDFPAGSAKAMYESVTQKLYTLPPETRLFVGHDYQPGGRDLAFETTVAESMETNIQLPGGRGEDEFVAFRTKRDSGLNAPRLLLPAVQVNINAGQLPTADDQGRRFLRIPLKGS